MEHTFETYGVDKETTDNLMDYSEGATHLTCWQWDLLHNPIPVWSFLDGDESGRLEKEETKLICITEEISQRILAYKYVLAANGEYIELPSDYHIKELAYEDKSANPAPVGSLVKFEDNNGVEYITCYNTGSGEFTGYFRTGSTCKAEGKMEFQFIPNQGNEAARIVIDKTNCRVTVDGTDFNLPEAYCTCGDVKLREYGQRLYDNNISKLDVNDLQAIEELRSIAAIADEIGEEYFEGFMQGKQWDQDPKSSNDIFAAYFQIGQTPDYSFESLNNLKKKLEDYKAAINTFNSITNQANCTKEEILKIINDNFTFGDDYRYLFNAPLVSLTATQRINALKALKEGFITGRTNVGSDWQEEDIILEILHTTPSEQQKSILEALNSMQLLYPLTRGVDGDNYYKFIETVTKWIVEVYPPEDINIADKLDNKEYLLFNNNYLGSRNHEDIDEKGNISLSVKRWFTDKPEYEIVSPPYNFLLVTFENDFVIGDSRFSGGQTYKLPALYVYMLFHKDTYDKLLHTGKTIVDVGLVALGVAELKAAIGVGQWARVTLAAADIGIGFVDIVINDGFKNEIQGNYPEFYENWQMISFCYGMGRITQVGLEAAYKRANIESWIMKTDASLLPETQQAAGKIGQRLQDQAYFGAEFVDDGVREINRLEGQVQAIESRMFVEGRTLDADAVNCYLYRISSGKLKPPYKAGTIVNDVKVKKGDKLYCLEEKINIEMKPGNWMTDKSTFNSLDEAREQLAITKGFKPDGKEYVIREYTVIKDFDTRMGIIGRQDEIVNGVVQRTYNGGANQWEINHINIEGWDKYLRMTVIDGNDYVKALNF